RASSFDGWRVDLRCAARSLAKARGLSAAAILTLALGLGAAIAVFSVVEAVLLRPLPFTDPSRAMWLSEVFSTTGENMSIAWPDFQDWQRRLQSFDTLGAVRPMTFTVTGGTEPERVQGRLATAGFLRVLNVQPALGRFFTTAEDRLG